MSNKFFYACLFVLLIANVCAASTPLVFPQGTRLEWCIRSNLANPYATAIYPETAAEVTVIKCDDTGITSLEGIEQFPNLQHLNMGVRGTLIYDLTPLANLTNLVRLEITRSHIDNLTPLMGLNQLNYLDLSENHVTDLTPLDNMTSIQRLILYHQGADDNASFDAFNKAHPIKLIEPTDTLDSIMTRREEIHLQTDYIKDITPLDNLTNMLALNLQDNKIDNLSALSQMHNLQYLHVGDNRLLSIAPLDNLTSLRMVDFTLNGITTLAPLKNSPNLYAVYAAHNRLTAIDFIDNTSIITHVDIMRNSVSDISPLADLFRPALLRLDQNHITDISPIKRIIADRFVLELGLSYNCIPDLDEMSALHFLQTVRTDHQCEAMPSWNVYDESMVVNKDMLMYSAGESNAPLDSPDDSVLAHTSKPSGAGGCSIAGGSVWEIAVLVALSAVALAARRRRR